VYYDKTNISIKKTAVLFKNVIFPFSCFGNGACSEILWKINRDIKTPTLLCSLPYPPLINPLINTKKVISMGPYKELNPAMFYWNSCTKPGTRAAHVFVCEGYWFCLFLRFFCWILELFPQCAIFWKLIYVFLYLFNYYLDLFYYTFLLFVLFLPVFVFI